MSGSASARRHAAVLAVLLTASAAQALGVSVTPLTPGSECAGYEREDGPVKPRLPVRWSLAAGGATWWSPEEPGATGLALMPDVSAMLLERSWRCRGYGRAEGGRVETWEGAPTRRLSLGLGVDALLLPSRDAWGTVRPLARAVLGHFGTLGKVPFWEASLAAGPTLGARGVGFAVSASHGLLAFELVARYGYTPSSSEHVLALALGIRDVNVYIAGRESW
ncbi:MAG TPA: hypothetical protein VE153_09655 [Myxococcus sp.]|nr:hypothetical protein [Myxococcus sp.]